MSERMRRVNESVRQVLAETLPELQDPRIGLVAHGGASPAAVADVDHLRFYASTWPSDPGAG